MVQPARSARQDSRDRKPVFPRGKPAHPGRLFGDFTAPGDTVYARPTVLDIQDNKSRPGQGIVTVRTEGYKLDGAVFMMFERSCLLPSRTA
jgi:acyl dehydratase